MSSFAHPMIAPQQERDAADDDHGGLGDRGELEDEVGPDDQVDAGGHHRRRVDERRDRRRALHRVEQPGLQRHLGGLAAGAEQEQQAEGVERGALGAAAAALTPANVVVPKVTNISMIASDMPMSPTRLMTNAFLAAAAADGLCCQKPISRYDARPTPSQPRNSAEVVRRRAPA